MTHLLLSLLATLLHAAVLATAAPLVAGLAATCRARLLGRRGPPPLQDYRGLQKLLRKEPVVPDNGSALYPAWPFIGLTATATAALLVPSFCTGMATAGQSDAITVLGLLALARAVLLLAALETGIGFGGVAVGGAVFSSLCGGAALLLVVLTLGRLADSPTLDGIGAGLRHAPISLPLGLALLALLALVLGEASNGAVEHDELAPGQQALSLTYSGRLLALFHYAAMLRFTLWLTFIAGLFPYVMGDAGTVLTWPGGLLLWAIKLAVLIPAFALFEIMLPRPRPAQVPAVLGAAALLGLLAVLFTFIGRTGA